MARQSIFLVLMFGVALISPVGPASAQAKPPGPVATGVGKTSAERMLAPKDRLKIDVAGRGGFSGAALVLDDGLIFLPSGDSVRASGRTSSELADQIAKVVKDGGIVVEPVVTVELIPVEEP